MIVGSDKQFQIEIDNIFYPWVIPLKDNKSSDLIILIVLVKQNSFFIGLHFMIFIHSNGFGYNEPFFNNKCTVYNCGLTKNKSRIKESDMVVFSLVNKINKNQKIRK